MPFFFITIDSTSGEFWLCVCVCQGLSWGLKTVLAISYCDGDWMEDLA